PMRYATAPAARAREVRLIGRLARPYTGRTKTRARSHWPVGAGGESPGLSAVRTLTPQRVASGRLLGPFRTAAAARDAKALLEAVMPLKTCSQSPRAAAATPCAAAQVGRCHGPCAGQTDAEAYAESLGALRDLYTGVMEGFLDAARQRIGELAAQERYEAAGA